MRRYDLLMLVAAALVGWSTLQPSLALPDLGIGFDKIAHCVLAAVLAAYLARGSRNLARMLASVLLVSVAAAAVEIVQAAVPGRWGSVEDFLAGVLGALVGVGASMAFEPLRRLATRALGAALARIETRVSLSD